MIWPFRRKAKAKKPISSIQLFIGPFLLCAVLSITGLLRPFEDLAQGGRDFIRSQPADQSIVLVAIDDATEARFGSTYFSRKHYADLLDRLDGAGVNKVLFDEAFSRPIDTEGDDAFAAALARHKGKVVLGALNYRNEGRNEVAAIPLEKFRSQAPYASYNVRTAPFNLTVDTTYGNTIEGALSPSLSSVLAGKPVQGNGFFRPDWSIRTDTVPVISFVDLIDGKVPQSAIRGKNVLVGVTAQTSNDFIQVINHGWIPGAYAHIIGGLTLKKSNPSSFGMLPIFIIATALSIVLLRCKSNRLAKQILYASAAIGVIAPFVLDSFQIHLNYLSSYLLVGLVAYRSNTWRQLNEARLRNASTLLPNLSALREEQQASGRPIFAMRIRNYAAVGATFSESVESELINEVVRRLTLPGEMTNFFQAEDVLYWLGPDLPIHELEDHVAGLSRLMESTFLIRGRKVDVHVAFGVDVDLTRPVANRIGRALLAADSAAQKHQPFLFNMSDNDEESVWELSLMSELDAAIDNGDIWIAFQPQFELKNDQIIGAEALVRWQHPNRGAISPEAFILSAEAHNRIGRLTFHVLELATRACVSIVRSNPQFRLSVNISASLMEVPNLPAQIIETLARTGFPATNLTLEVTESAPFSEHPLVAANLAGITAMGVELSIDDYGTGNATLEYFRTVPCHEIKIDRRFVTDIIASNGDMLLVESTIELSHGMGRRVIAEGIEDPETLELLRAIGCDIAQGYYLAKPMRIEALESLLSLSARIRAA